MSLLSDESDDKYTTDTLFCTLCLIMTNHLWELFDPEIYVRDNYVDLHDEDRRIIDILVPYFEKKLSGGCRVLDIGTGPNLYPLMAISPYASTIDCLEISSRNIDFLTRQLHKPSVYWNAFSAYMSSLNIRYKKRSIARLRQNVVIRKGSILKRPDKAYDVVMMFFCAESITSSALEFEVACDNFIRSAKPKGMFVAAFMENSCGYSVGPIHFPAYPVHKKLLECVFTPHCDSVTMYHIPRAKEPLRDGYTGMVLLVGTKK